MKDLYRDLKTVNAELQKELAAVFKKYGVDAAFAGSRCDATQGEYKMRLSISGVDPYAESFKKNAKVFGMQPSWLGRSFKSFSGHTFTITGLDIKKRKRPVRCSRPGSDKTWIFTETEIKHFMETA